jgi:hypothetical protein
MLYKRKRERKIIYLKTFPRVSVGNLLPVINILPVGINYRNLTLFKSFYPPPFITVLNTFPVHIFRTTLESVIFLLQLSNIMEKAYFHSFCCSFLLPEFPRFFYIWLSVYRPSFSRSFSGFLATNSFGSPLSENFLISPSSLKYFHWIWDSRLTVLFCTCLKVIVPLQLSSFHGF